MIHIKVSPYSIEPCFGNKGCPNSIHNTEQLIKELKDILEKEKIEDFLLNSVKGKLKMHNTFRVGIANCPNACSQVHIKDFGIIVRAKVRYIKEKCNICGKCVRACPDSSINIKNDEIEINFDKCSKCGLCAKICPEKAIVIDKIGYSIIIGGKLGRHPSLAITLNDFITDIDKVLDFFKKVIYFYKKNSKNGERVGTIIQRIGIHNFLNSIGGER